MTCIAIHQSRSVVHFVQFHKNIFLSFLHFFDVEKLMLLRVLID